MEKIYSKIYKLGFKISNRCECRWPPRKNFIQLKLSHNLTIPSPFRNSKRFLQLSPSNRPLKRLEKNLDRSSSTCFSTIQREYIYIHRATPRIRWPFRSKRALYRSLRIGVIQTRVLARETESTRLDDPSRFVEDATALQTVYHSGTVHVYTHTQYISDI